MCFIPLTILIQRYEIFSLVSFTSLSFLNHEFSIRDNLHLNKEQISFFNVIVGVLNLIPITMISIWSSAFLFQAFLSNINWKDKYQLPALELTENQLFFVSLTQVENFY